MKRALIAMALLPPLLGGCAASTNDNPSQGTGNSVSVHRVSLPDGRSVLCVWERASIDSGGLSCDWVHLR